MTRKPKPRKPVSAKRFVRKAVSANKLRDMAIDSLSWIGPNREDTDLSEQHVWTTRCGRYRVIRSISKFTNGQKRFVALIKVHRSEWVTKPGKPNKENRRHSWISIRYDGGPSYCRSYRSLESALSEVATHDGAIDGNPPTPSNAIDIIESASRAGLAFIDDDRPKRAVSSSKSMDSIEDIPTDPPEKLPGYVAQDSDQVPNGKRGPKSGVLATMLTILQTATRKKPMSFDEILDRMVDRFPDRNRNSMHETIRSQIGRDGKGKLFREKGISIGVRDGRYWIESTGK